MAKPKTNKKLWDGISDDDFVQALDDAEEVDLGEFNEEHMIIFSANVNYARQLLRLSDSLKPSHRRILYMMYKNSLRNGAKKKSISVVGSTTDIHPHGGASIYETMIGLGQYWKMPVPLVKIIGSFGTEVSQIYAADRYTEITMSDYAWDCFFKDFDPDCVQMIWNTAGARNEPVSLPSRYPNMLINGGRGIAVGNSFMVAPYNIFDIIKQVKKRLHGGTGHVYMVPDLPTGCDIVDDEGSIKEICETGRGTLRMRAKIEIQDEKKYWCLRVTNIPWGVATETIMAALVKCTEDGSIPIKEVQPRHEQEILEDGKTVVSHVDLAILIDKSHDPYSVREKLFKKTKLEETIPINFKVVMEELTLENFNLAQLIDAWIAQRREYKRRLINKRITKITAQIELLKIKIDVMKPGNLEQTVSIIRNSPEDMIAHNLIKKYGMSSYQAEQIGKVPLSEFNASAPKKLAKELKEKEEELDRQFKLVRSEKDIDEIIDAELDELKKYAQPRKSQLVNPSGQTMDTESEYFVLTTKKGGIKKVSLAAVERTRRGFGAFENGDMPSKNILRGKNMDAIIFVDSFGRFTIMKIGDINTVALNEYPMKAYDVIKLEGDIVSMKFFQNSESLKWLKEKFGVTLNLITFSKCGVGKKTPAESLIEQTEDGCKTVRNSKLTRLKPDDALAHADYYMDDAQLLVYTKKGEFNYILASHVPEFGRDAAGNQLVKLGEDDEVVSCCVVGPNTQYVTIVTAKGKVKKCEVEYLGKPSAAKGTSYLITLDEGDEVIFADTPEKHIDVCLKSGHQVIELNQIRTLSRKAKGVKMISLQNGESIVQVLSE